MFPVRGRGRRGELIVFLCQLRSLRLEHGGELTSRFGARRGHRGAHLPGGGGSNERSSEAIRGHQRPPEATRGHRGAHRFIHRHGSVVPTCLRD